MELNERETVLSEIVEQYNDELSEIFQDIMREASYKFYDLLESEETFLIEKIREYVLYNFNIMRD